VLFPKLDGLFVVGPVLKLTALYPPLAAILRLETHITFRKLRYSVHPAGRRPVQKEQVRRHESECGGGGQHKKRDGGHGARLVTFDDRPQAEYEKDKGHQQAETKIDQHLYQDLEAVFDDGFVPAATDGSNTHEHDVPHRLSFGETLAGVKSFPERILESRKFRLFNFFKNWRYESRWRRDRYAP